LDLAIGAVGDTAGGTDWGGGLYVISDTAGFIGQKASDVIIDYQAHIWGEDDTGYLGWSVTGTGDLDGDGYEELVVSAPNGGSSDVGEVWVLSGELLTGDSRVDDVALLRFLGADNDSQWGTGLLGHADFDGDGVNDLVMTALGWDPANGSDVSDGKVVVYLSSEWVP
jgi:hypothetical protein